MYSQLIYFIVALMLFTIQQPGNNASFYPLSALLTGIGLLILYALLCRTAFHRLMAAVWEDLPQSALSYRYYRLQSRLSILALGIFSAFVYLLNIKFYLQAIPGFQKFLTLSEASGLAIYVLLLGIMWFFSYPLYRQVSRSDLSLAVFLKGQFSLNAAILLPWFLISAFLDLSDFFGGTSFLSSDSGQALSLGVVLLCFIFWGPFLIVRLWGCKPLPQTRVREELEDFILAHRFKIGDFLQWPLLGGEMLTAGIMGILPQQRYILITRGLSSLLTVDELKAVVAHEIGHVRRQHLLFFLLFFLSFSIMTYALNDLLLLSLLQNSTLLKWALARDTLHLTLFSLAYSTPVLVLLIVYFRYIFGFFLRNSERQADLYAMQMIGHPFTLISSLEKIAFYSGRIEDLPSWHHFSIRERVEFLMRSYEDRALIKKHHRKLYSSAVLLLTAVAAIAVCAGHIKDTSLVKKHQNEMQFNILKEEILNKPDNAELFAAYGSFLLEKGRIADAEVFLQKAKEMAADDPAVLNNLAWLYATAPPPHFHPEKALELARAAVALKPAPYTLDTLAEAYYANGRYEEAMQSIEKAIAEQPKNKTYFVRQREKFQKALERSGRAKAGEN